MIENIKAVKALFLALIAPLSDALKLEFFKTVKGIVEELIVVLEGRVSADNKPTNRVIKTLQTIGVTPPVAAYQGQVDGRITMLETGIPLRDITKPLSTQVAKPIQVSTITRKVDGSIKVQVPKVEKTLDAIVLADGRTVQMTAGKRAFFPGMNTGNALSFMYYVNGRKGALKAFFTASILKHIGHTLSPKDLKTYLDWGYSIPKKAIKAGECKVWEKSYGGDTYRVMVDPKSVA